MPGTSDASFADCLVDRAAASADLVAEIAVKVASAQSATEMRQFFEAHLPIVARLPRGEGRSYVIPDYRLAAPSAPDYLVALVDDDHDTHWLAIFVCDPGADMYSSGLALTDETLDAFAAVDGWRQWLAEHPDHIPDESGTGAIARDHPACILMGRHVDMTPEEADRRRELQAERNLELHRYEWVTARAK